MKKLIDAYAKNPTDANALRLAHHAKKHPMAICMISMADAAILERAREQLRPIVEKLNAVIMGEGF